MELEKSLDGAHAVVLGVVLNFSQPQRFQQGWNVHGKSPPQTLLQSIPTAHRVVLRASPYLHSSFCGWLLFVCAAEQPPVAMRLEHGMPVFNATKMVAEFGRPYNANQSWRVG